MKHPILQGHAPGSIIKSPKGFKIMIVTLSHIHNWGGLGICDSCNARVGGEGVYVAALNWVVCERCFEDWHSRARWYSEDRHIEERNILHYHHVVNRDPS